MSTKTYETMSENKLEIFARRLKLARIKAKLSMEALCNSMNGLVSKQAISKYESAKMLPSSTVLISLASNLNVDVDYFFRPFTFEIDDFNMSFRKKADVGSKETSALKVQIQDDVERYLEIEEILGVKESYLKQIQCNKIETISDVETYALMVRQYWSLGIDGIANVQETLESHGVKLIYTDAPESFDGVSGIVNGTHSIIVLNSKKTNIERRRLTSLHELGHLLLNEKFPTELPQKEQEKLCNAFASEMLLPSEIISCYFRNNSSIAIEELVSLSEAYGISIDAIVHKLHSLRIVNDDRYRSFYIRKSKYASFKRLVEESRYKECKIDRFKSMVYSALAQQLISVNKAASLLQCSVDHVRKNSNVV